jgi:hypothetical protein
MFRVYNKGTDYFTTDKYIQFIRHVQLNLYQKIVCRIFIKTDQYVWSNKVAIELLEPSFSDFLLG